MSWRIGILTMYGCALAVRIGLLAFWLPVVGRKHA